MKALVVIDMQQDYVGKNSKYKLLNKQQLIENINNRIKAIEKENGRIIYIKNMRKGVTSHLVESLYIASDLTFIKEHSSAFTCNGFLQYIYANNINQIEIVGIDGNSCVKSTAIDGIKNNLFVTLPSSCIGVVNHERFVKTKEELIKRQIKIID